MSPVQPRQQPSHPLHGPRARALRLLRGGDSDSLGQGVRFVAAGCIVAVVYLTTTTVLAEVIGLPFEVALPIGFGLALAVHFTLQRLFVWSQVDSFVLPLRQQIGRYLAAAAAQYGLTAASTAVLPSALSLPTEAVYLATAGILAVLNFLVFRRLIFHVDTGANEPTRTPAIRA